MNPTKYFFTSGDFIKNMFSVLFESKIRQTNVFLNSFHRRSLSIIVTRESTLFSYSPYKNKFASNMSKVIF